MILQLSDHDTMMPAAIAESLTILQGIIHACNCSVDCTGVPGDAATTFLATLLSHILRPTLLAHMHSSALQLSEATCVGDMQPPVLTWLVLFWQALESQRATQCIAPSLLSDDASMNATTQILCVICAQIRTSQVAGILNRYVPHLRHSAARYKI